MKVDEILQKYKTSTVEEISNFTPAEISAELIILTSKLTDAGALRLSAEQKETQKWLELRKTFETDGQTNRAIKATNEYAEYQKCVYIEKAVIEMIRSLKKLLQSKGDEMRNLNY